jgi:hypothetical protein
VSRLISAVARVCSPVATGPRTASTRAWVPHSAIATRRTSRKGALGLVVAATAELFVVGPQCRARRRPHRRGPSRACRESRLRGCRPGPLVLRSARTTVSTALHPAAYGLARVRLGRAPSSHGASSPKTVAHPRAGASLLRRPRRRTDSMPARNTPPHALATTVTASHVFGIRDDVIDDVPMDQAAQNPNRDMVRQSTRYRRRNLCIVRHVAIYRC